MVQGGLRGSHFGRGSIVRILGLTAAAFVALPGLGLDLAPTAAADQACLRPHYYWWLCVNDQGPGYLVDRVADELEENAAYAEFNVDQLMAEQGKGFVINPLTDIWRMDHEPNAPQGGTTATGEAYQADANNIASALRGNEPHIVLNVKYGVGCWPVAVWCSLELARDLEGAELIVPGEAAFVALYGEWSDYNGDGFVQETGVQECSDVGEGEHIQLTLRPEGDTCREDEWNPITELRGSENEPRVVAYVSPGDWSRDGLPRHGERQPDLFFHHVGHGVYVAPGQYFPSRVSAEGSLLTQVVVEGFEGVLTLDGPQAYRPVEDTPTDTDLYHAVDPTVEAFHGSIVGGNGRAVSEAASGALDRLPVPADPSTSHWITGPAATATMGRYAREQTWYDHQDGWHPYLDVRLTETAYASAGFLRAESRPGPDTPLIGGPDASAPGQFVVTGHLGIWKDENLDDWIGNPTPSDFCPDVYDCGNTPDPNEYSSHEFVPYCPTGTFMVAVVPDTPGGRWPTGAYVWRDAQGSVTDVASDGDSDGLILGAAFLEVGCDPWRGILTSLDRLVLPAGDLDVGFTVSTPTINVRFFETGVRMDEATADHDVHRQRQV